MFTGGAVSIRSRLLPCLVGFVITSVWARTNGFSFLTTTSEGSVLSAPLSPWCLLYSSGSVGSLLLMLLLFWVALRAPPVPNPCPWAFAFGGFIDSIGSVCNTLAVSMFCLRFSSVNSISLCFLINSLFGTVVLRTLASPAL
uniref:Putative secreted peptide n=1 Tax=Anopheles braziliensis TaxID=58242 RepID=A0A2M3ZNP9_9DIPT